MKKCIALYVCTGNVSHGYGESPAIQNDTMLTATRHTLGCLKNSGFRIRKAFL